MSKTLSVTLTCLGLGVIAAGVGCRGALVAADGKEPHERPPVRVAVQLPTPTPLQRTSTQPATVHAYFEARIFAKVSGFVSQLKADIGQPVRRGDVLAVVDLPEMQKQLEAKAAAIRRLESEERRAAAQVTVARANVASYQAKLQQTKAQALSADAALSAAAVELQRATELVEQRAVAERVLDEARKKHEAVAADKQAALAVIAAAEQELALAEARVEASQAEQDVAGASTDVARRELEELAELMKYATLTAPLDGMVSVRNIAPGDLVRNAQTSSGSDATPLFVVVQADKVRVRIAVPERDAPLANVGDEVRLEMPALPGQSFTGQIARTAGVLDEATRTMLVEVDLPNADGKLLPGMFGQATILLDSPSESLTLPAGTLRFDEQGQASVYVVNEENEVEIVNVQTGVDDGKRIAITGGLAATQRVVGPMLQRLKAGQKVLVE